MKKLKSEILLTFGVGLVVYNILNFRYGSYQGGHYYYEDSSLALLSIGAMFIIFAVLMIKNRQK